MKAERKCAEEFLIKILLRIIKDVALTGMLKCTFP
jgi:hypothetical protein